MIPNEDRDVTMADTTERDDRDEVAARRRYLPALVQSDNLPALRRSNYLPALRSSYLPQRRRKSDVVPVS